MKKLLLLVPVLLLAASLSFAATSADTTLTVLVGAEAAISVDTTPAFTSAPPFGNFTGTTTFKYWIRTTPTTGTGVITLKVSSDFAPTGGPSVGSPLVPTDTLTYVSTVASPGTAVNGTAALTDTNVATFSAGASSGIGGNSGNSVAWTLVNDPAYPAKSYTATVTFTISAT